MKFYLGTHLPSWLYKTEVPLFVSRRTMPKKRFKRATCDWALDSGGFTELTMHGEWTIGPEEYADEVRRYMEGVGRMDWAAIQDWMCEPAVIEGGHISGRNTPGTGHSLRDHQLLTVQSCLDLREIAPEVPWAPVLQGWEIDDYLQNVVDYFEAGIDLMSEPVVGVGSVCRRQATDEIAEVFRALHEVGLNLHGFGVKKNGLRKAAKYLWSADSLAWSFNARRTPILLECCIAKGNKNCANCITYAHIWREEILDAISTST